MKLLFLILSAAFMVRFIGMNYGLPQLYHTEEYKTVNYALKMAGTKNLNPKFFEYPTLYLYFMMVIYGIWFLIGKILGIYATPQEFAYSFIRDPTTLYMIGRTLSALWGTGVVYLVYLIGKKICNYRVGIISALVISFIPCLVASSHMIKPDMAMLFFSLLSFYWIIKIIQTQNNKYYYLTGITIGIATSIKYLPIILSILLPLLHIVRKQKLFDKKLIISLMLIPIFFVIGTPFSILSFKEFFKDFQGLLISTLPPIDPLVKVKITFIELISINSDMGYVPYLGVICLLGLFLSFRKLYPYSLLMITVILTNFIMVARHYLPSRGFLFIAIPFFIIFGAKFIDDISLKFKKAQLLVYVFAFLCLLPSIVESILMAYSLTLKDTRTIALEWIEKNIPFGSKILIDRYPSSPQIKMTKSQLEKLYKKAVELNHYKKEYFKYQLEVHPGEKYGYEIYEVEHPAHEIGTIKHQVEEAQKVRQLVDVSYGVKYLKSLGIEYFIWNSFSANGIKEPGIKDFYSEVERTCKIIKEFKPETKFHRGPTIKIYEL